MFPARAAALLVTAAWALPAQDSVRIAADPARRFQTIAGFGVNFNGAYFHEAQFRDHPRMDWRGWGGALHAGESIFTLVRKAP